MKIAVTADIHYGNKTRKIGFENFLKELNKTGADFLIIAGDLASRGADHKQFAEAVKILGSFNGEVLFSPGNHDLWTKKGNSFNILTKKIPDIFAGTNCHLLDGNPVVAEKTGFVGSVGWYDYSYRFVPIELEKLFEDYLFTFDNGDTALRWSGLTPSEYEGKECMVSADGEKWHKSTWQDKRFIKWDFSDSDFLDYCIKRLKADIESIYSVVDKIVVITHHLPFSRFVPDIPDPTWGFHRAYLGSEKIGKVLLQYSKVKYSFFGHSHRNIGIQINGLWAKNVYYGDTGAVTLLDI